MTDPNIQRYDIAQSWEWNLRHAPDEDAPVTADPVLSPGNWNWCGVPVSSPLGIPAGPLLNGRWILHYAKLGFDILTYKTVRSAARECYPLPNLLPVELPEQLTAPGRTLTESAARTPTWAVSFGMPSVDPVDWRADIAFTKTRLPAGKALVVSVVGSETTTPKADDGALQQLADDFSQCAAWAVESGADGIEANFSCPNVTSPDGSLYQQPQDAGFTASRIRQAIGATPLVLKIGYVASPDQAAELIETVAPFVDGLAMTNSISATVRSVDGTPRFAGAARGICGEAIRAASIRQVEMFRATTLRSNVDLTIHGVGGISSDKHVRQFLDAGADSVGLATAVMQDPHVGRRIRRAWPD